jgi:hypothetical protein
MEKGSNLKLSRRFWQCGAITLAWWALSGGILSLIVGVGKGGIINTLIGIVALALVFSRRALNWLEGRAVQKPLAVLALLWYAFLPVMLLGFIVTTPTTLGFQLPYLVVREVVLVVLVGILIWQYLASARSLT